MTTPSANVIAAARAAQAKHGIPASVSIAQWALESGWGKHDLGAFNYFGMKCRVGHDDPFVMMRTRECDSHGKSFFIDAKFRKFSCIDEAFDAHAALLADAPVYARARAKLPDPNAFADALTGVYATDPKYGTLLKSIMHGSSLQQYDLGE